MKNNWLFTVSFTAVLKKQTTIRDKPEKPEHIEKPEPQPEVRKPVKIINREPEKVTKEPEKSSREVIKPEKSSNGVSETVVEDKLVKPSAAKLADKASAPDAKPRFTKSSLRSVDKNKQEEKLNDKVEKPTLRSVRTIDDKAKEKSVTIVDRKPDKNGTAKTNNTVNNKANDKVATNSINKETKATKVAEPPKVEEKVEEKTKMATKPPTPLEKTPSKVLSILYIRVFNQSHHKKIQFSCFFSIETQKFLKKENNYGIG